MASNTPAITTRAGVEEFLDARIGHGVKPGLERIEGLLAFMGDPHTSYPSVHVAGTNGKTTVSRMLQQILGAHGLAVGGFTSPHLEILEERFSLFGAPIDGDALTRLVSDNAWFVVGYEEASASPVTYFEVTAALAFALFADAAVDVAVIEVGLGGRLDATNVIDADVSVITGIDLDHMEFLGPTLTDIAGEKAAILKDGGILVTGPLPDEAVVVASQRAQATSSRWMHFGRDFEVLEASPGVGGWQCSVSGVFSDYDELFLPIHGRHHVDNLATAIAASEMFMGRSLDPDSLAVAAGSMRNPGRLEVVGRRPLVLIDGAHNPQGFRGLAASIEEEFPPMEWQLVIGVRGERSVAELVSPLAGSIGHVFATQADDPASIPASEVGAAAGEALDVGVTVIPASLGALAAATAAAGPGGGVVVAGSLYVVGEVRAAYAIDDHVVTESHMRFEAERPGQDGYEDEDDEGEDPGLA